MRSLCAILAALSISTGTAQAAPDLQPVPHPDVEALDPEVRDILEPAMEHFSERVDGAEGETLGELYGALGMHYQAQEFQDAAEAAYENALRLQPRDFRWLYYMGFLMEETGDSETAMTNYSRALLVEPEYTPGRVRLARVALQARHDALAEREFRRVLETDGENAPALAGLGELAAREGRHEEAVDLYRRVLEIQPNAGAVRGRLVESLQALGRTEEAEGQMDRVDGRETYVPDPMLVLMTARSQGSERLIAQGMSALQQGKLLPAKNAFSLAVSINPLDPAARVSLGRINIREGAIEAAEQEFRRAIEIDPDYSLAYFNLGDLLIRQGKDAEGAQALRSAIRSGTTQDLARAMLADTLMRLGRYEEAVPLYETLAERPREEAATGPDPKLRQGLAQVAAGDCTGALRSFAAAMRREQQDPMALQALVRTSATCPGATEAQRSQGLELAKLLYQRIPQMQTAETLAMALAANGEYQQAVELQAQAIFEAVKAEVIEDNPQLRANMDRYEASRPAEQPWPAGHAVYRPGGAAPDRSG